MLLPVLLRFTRSANRLDMKSNPGCQVNSLVKITPYGWQAALIDCQAKEVAGVSAVCLESGLFTEVVPAECTVLVCWSEKVALTKIEELAKAAKSHVSVNQSRLVEIPVTYNGQDLAEVAQLTGLSINEVIELHSGTIFEATFAGFAPGFMYCTGLPDILKLPRRLTPRINVPAGSLAIADSYTAIYPLNSPGGWHLLGTTLSKMFDMHASQPSLLLPGDQVKFLPVQT